MENTTRVGVYGTLKQGFGNHRLINAEPVGTGVVRGHRLFESGIPFLVEDASSDYDVHVEYYDVDDETLARLDRLEGHPSCYCRKEMYIHLADEEVTSAWVYQYPSPVGRENTTGIYPLENYN